MVGAPLLMQCTLLTKKFGGFTAVDEVTFEVDNGEVFGLLGPNVAGKTTNMRLLSTLLKPTSRTATVSGYDLLCVPARVPDDEKRLSHNGSNYNGGLSPARYSTSLHSVAKLI
jgi:ABC-type Na+ transport system ATPase subunit NatA